MERDLFHLFEDLKYIKDVSYYAQTDKEGKRIFPVMLVIKIKAELELYPKPIVIDKNSTTREIITKIGRLHKENYSQYISTFEDNFCFKFLALKDLNPDELKEFNMPKLLQDEILARLNPELQTVENKVQVSEPDPLPVPKYQYQVTYETTRKPDVFRLELDKLSGKTVIAYLANDEFEDLHMDFKLPEAKQD